MYFYPMYIDDHLIDVIASSDKIVPYLDMPLQHVSDTMLKRMSRRVSKNETIELVEKLRSRIPNLVLRTTFITGFPGETEEQFEELVDFVKAQKFERMGVFVYSYEADTPAAQLPDHIPDDVMETRRERLMQVQQDIAFEWNDRQIGKQIDVILDGPVPNEPTAWIGRSYADAPDVDGLVFVTGEHLAAGQIVKCEVVATRDYDLIGVAV